MPQTMKLERSVALLNEHCLLSLHLPPEISLSERRPLDEPSWRPRVEKLAGFNAFGSTQNSGEDPFSFPSSRRACLTSDLASAGSVRSSVPALQQSDVAVRT